jgi:cell division protein FtsB
MREFQERRRMRRFLHSRYAIAVLLVLCALLARGVWSVYQKYERSKELAQRTQGELAELEARQKTLSQLNASLETEQGKEREIRDRFGVVKPGERMVVVVDDATRTDDGQSDGAGGWWQRFLGWFR